MGYEDARPRPFHLGVGGSHEIGVLGKRGPYFAPTTGNRLLQHLGARQKVAAKSEHKRGTGLECLRPVKDVQVGDLELALNKPFNNIAIFMVAPYRIDRNAKQDVPIDVGLKLSQQSCGSGGSDLFPAGKSQYA